MINRKQEWQIPPINAQEVPTQTPQIPGQVQDIAGRVAGNLRRDLAQPQQAYSQFVANRTGPTANVQPDFNTQ